MAPQNNKKVPSLPIERKDECNILPKPRTIILSPTYPTYNPLHESSEDLEEQLPDGARLLSTDVEHHGDIISDVQLDKFEEFAIVYRHCSNDDHFNQIPWSVIVMTREVINEFFEIHPVNMSKDSYATILHRKQGVESSFLDYLEEGTCYRFNAVAPNPLLNVELFGFKRKEETDSL